MVFELVKKREKLLVISLETKLLKQVQVKVELVREGKRLLVLSLEI